MDEEIRKKRGEIIMEQQYNIFEKLNHDNIGKTMRCVVEGCDGYTDSYYGRIWRDAPDIDGSVSFTCGYELNGGDFVDVEIFDVNEYDLNRRSHMKMNLPNKLTIARIIITPFFLAALLWEHIRTVFLSQRRFTPSER